MPAKAPTHSASFREFADLLVLLHRLSAVGKGESAEADLLRDEMDSRWEQLDTEQAEVARGLAADLNWLLIGPVTKKVPSSIHEYDQQLSLECTGDQSDQFATLRALRSLAGTIPADLLASKLGSIWFQLGQYEVAQMFFDHAGYPEHNGPA